MNYDSPAQAYDEKRDANAPLYRVVSVQQSTQFVRRRERKVRTDLILVSSRNRVAVRVDEARDTGTANTAPRWQVGDSVSIPNSERLQSPNFSPDALDPAAWDTARQRPRDRMRSCL